MTLTELPASLLTPELRERIQAEPEPEKRIAETRARIERGAQMLWDMEQAGEKHTEKYVKFLAHYCSLLVVYEAFCDGRKVE